MNEDFVAHCLELLAPLGAARAKRMFGGHGVYLDELFIGLVHRSQRLYLRADAATQARFEAAGCERFTYPRGDKLASLPFFTVPEDALDSPRAMEPWARLALEASLRVRAARAPKATRKKPRARPRARRAA